MGWALISYNIHDNNNQTNNISLIQNADCKSSYYYYEITSPFSPFISWVKTKLLLDFFIQALKI